MLKINNFCIYIKFIYFKIIEIIKMLFFYIIIFFYYESINEQEFSFFLMHRYHI